MNYVVKILRNEDGEKVEKPVWCYVQNWGDSSRTLCGGEVFGMGEGSAEFDTKEVKRGGITCKQCLDIIHEMKSIKL